MGLLQTNIDVKSLSSKQISSELSQATKEGGGGISEVAFMIRAFTPEEELADGVSAVLAS